MSRWISVKEQLPENCVRVLVCFENYRYIDIDFYDHGFESWYSELDSEEIRNHITHWMPLPDPPTKMKGD